MAKRTVAIERYKQAITCVDILAQRNNDEKDTHIVEVLVSNNDERPATQ